MKIRPPRERAFTLIELLVVITIIAVLTSLVFAGVQHSQRTAEKAKCAGNMRQFYTATISYAAENNGTLPGPLWAAQPAWYRAESYSTDGVLLNFIAPYLGYPKGTKEKQRADIFMCPGWVRATTLQQQNNTDSRIYGVEGSINMTDGSAQRPFGYPGATSKDPPSQQPARLVNIDRPDEMVLLFDLDAVGVAPYKGKENTVQQPVHDKKKRNYLFADGHVEFREKWSRPK